MRATRKRPTSAVVNPRPHQRIRVHSPAPVKADIPATTAPVSLRAPPRVRPVYIGRLPSDDVIIWQLHVRATIRRATNPPCAEIKATDAENLARFIVVALKLLILKVPVTPDPLAGVNEATIDNVDSLFMTPSSFQT